MAEIRIDARLLGDGLRRRAASAPMPHTGDLWPASPSDYARALGRAEELLRNEYRFVRPLDMERCETRCVLPGPESIDWEVIPAGDEEWCFMLNRMDCLEDLAVAACSEEAIAAAAGERAAALILAWIEAHRTIEPSKSTRTLDTGIRLRMWAHVLPHLVALGHLSDDEAARIVRSMCDQVRYLHGHQLAKYQTSNWGLIQVAGAGEALSVAKLAGTELVEEMAEYQAWVDAALPEMLRAQTYPAGTNWELSPLYHIEVLHAAASYAAVVGADDAFHETLVHMARSLVAETMPDGALEAHGDSDRLPVAETALALGALIGCPELEEFAEGLGADGVPPAELLAAGALIRRRLEELRDRPAAPSDPFPRVFDDSQAGVYSVRSGYGRRANMMLFLNGPLGSGHGHADNLHVSAVCQGVPVLVDGGRYTYREDSPERTRLRGPLGHNVPLVDGTSSSVPSGSWTYASFVQPLPTLAVHHAEAGLHYFEGSYANTRPVSLVTRKLLFFEEGIWLCVDSALGPDTHAGCLVSRLQFGDMSATLEEDGLALSAADLHLALRFDRRCSCELGETAVSPVYNTEIQAPLAEISLPYQGECHLWWALLPEGYEIRETELVRGERTPVPSDLASGFEIVRDGEPFCRIAVFHREVEAGVKTMFFAAEEDPDDTRLWRRAGFTGNVVVEFAQERGRAEAPRQIVLRS